MRYNQVAENGDKRLKLSPESKPGNNGNKEIYTNFICCVEPHEKNSQPYCAVRDSVDIVFLFLNVFNYFISD